MPRRSSTLDSAKMLRASSSTSSTVRPTRSSSELLSRCSIRCLSAGRSVTMRCRNSAVSSSRRSGDSTPLTTMLRAMVCSCASSSTDNSRPVNTTTGTSDKLASARSSSSTSKPDMSGSRRSSTTQSQGSCRRRFKASPPVPAVTISMSSWPSSSVMLICSARSSSTTSRRLRRGFAYSLMRAKAASTPSVEVGLVTKENAPRASPCWRSSSKVMICTGICRVSGFCLSWLSTVQPSMSGRNTSSETAVGWYCLARSSASAPRIATSTLKPFSRARSTMIRA